MTKIQCRALLITACLSLAVVVGCGKKSSTDSGAEETGPTLSTKVCGTGKSCQGTYSALSSDSKIWSEICQVKQVDSGEWTKLWFIEASNCGFEWIRAQGTIGNDWATLASAGASEFMIQYTGEDIFQLRLCKNGGNKDSTRCL